MTSGAVEEKVDSKIGVRGSNPGRDCPVCELFRMAVTDDSYVKIPKKTDQNDEKNVRALIGFGEVKATKTDDFLCLNPKNFSTRVTFEKNLLVGISNICSVTLFVSGRTIGNQQIFIRNLFRTLVRLRPVCNALTKTQTKFLKSRCTNITNWTEFKCTSAMNKNIKKKINSKN